MRVSTRLMVLVCVTLTTMDRGQAQTGSLQLTGFVTDEAAQSILEAEDTPTLVNLDEPPATVDLSQLGQSEEVKERFSDGTVRISRWVVESPSGDWVNHGSYDEFDRDGTLVRSGSYKLGMRDGEWTQQIDETQIKQLMEQVVPGFKAPFTSKATFERGRLSDTWTCTDASGALVFVWTYQAGKRQGPATWFDSRGQVIQQINYDKDLASGPAKIVMSKEEGMKEVQFEDGLMLRRVDRWFPVDKGAKQRVLRAQENFLVPTSLNVAHSDWANNVIEYRTYDNKDSIRHGISITFHPSGQRESEGVFDHGRRNGTFVWWYPTGQERVRGEYQNDVEEGEWTWWHANGMKEAIGSFHAGRKVATWSVWQPDGKLVKRTEVDESRVAGKSSPTLE